MERRDGLERYLREQGADAVASLLAHRPDLAAPPVPTDLEELAARAEAPASLARAVADLTRPEGRLLQVVASLPPTTPADRWARSRPEGVADGDVAPVLARLAAAGLAWWRDGHLHRPVALPTVVDAPLGRPLLAFEEDLTLDHLKHAVRTLRATLTEAGGVGELPPWASAPRKAGLLTELAGLLAAEGGAAAVVRTAPPEAAALLRSVLEGEPPTTPLDHPLAFFRVPHRKVAQNTYRPPYAGGPAYWLFERGLLLPEPGGATATVPQELLLSWRDGRPVADLDLVPPALVVAEGEDDGPVDEEAGMAVARLLELLADLLDAWAAAPLPTLRDGGLGPAALRSVAGQLHLASPLDAARLVELAALAGLVALHPPQEEGGLPTAAPTPAAGAWQAAAPAARWRHLATAWRWAPVRPSRAGRTRDGDRVRPALAPPGPDHPPDPGAVRARDEVLAALRGLGPGQRTDPAALAARVAWNRPRCWEGGEGVDPPTAIGWVREEAELLGISALGALSGFGRALLDGDPAGAEAALAVALPPATSTVVLQADLTAVVLGWLERPVLAEMRLLADVESTGAATTFRFSPASLRRAFDAGRDAAAITAFLEAHGARGVPGPLAYLVADVARRHGHLVVAASSSVVTAEDPVVLAEVLAHQEVAPLGLRLLVPTVATATSPPDEVVAVLRSLGFLPVRAGAGPGVVAVGRARPGDDGPGGGPVGPAGDGELPVLAGPVAPPGPDRDQARRLAAALLEASPPPRPARGRASR